MKLNSEEALIRAALSEIETPAYEIERTVRNAMRQDTAARPRHFPRAALLAAALVAVLAVGAAAVSISGLWTRFFPNPVPSSAITTVNESQTAGGYTLTLEDAVADDNGIILLLTLSRADGGAIDPAIRLSSKSMHVKLYAGGEEFGGGFDRLPVLSDDGKSLLFCFEARSNRLSDFVGLSGKTLTFTADGVAVPLYSPGAFGYRPEEPADLAPLAEVEVPDLAPLGHTDFMEDGDLKPIRAAIAAQDISVPLPLDDEFPQCAVRGAVTLKEGLAIAIAQDRGESGSRVCTGILPSALIDTRDGTRYDMEQGVGFPLADGGETQLQLYTFYGSPLTAEDLPYLQLEVDYDIDEVYSAAPFSLTFVPDGDAAMILPMEQTVEVSGVTLHVEELRLSALRVNLRFGDPMDPISATLRATETAPVITLRDGTTVSTVWQGGSGGADACNVGFLPETENGERVFLDTALIASVTLGGTEIWTAP